jgi:hypothetical protein
MAQGRISGRLLRDDLARDANLTFNTNTLVVDYTNGRVGIGNVSPTDLLTVAGNVTAANIQISNNQILSVNANAHIVLSPNGVGNIDVSTNWINNVRDPIQAQDVASKAYVDSQLSASLGNTIQLGTSTDGNLVSPAAYQSWTTSTTVTDAIDDLNEVMLNVYNDTYVGSVDFTADTTSGGAGTAVTLTITHVGNANRYDITWGDGDTTTGTTDTTPTHTYATNVGSPFDVTVRAYNNGGSGSGSEASKTREDYITIYTADPVVSFAIYAASSGGSPINYWDDGDTVYLENTTTNIGAATIQFTIDWGDGSSDDVITDDTADGGTAGGRLAHTFTTSTEQEQQRTVTVTLDSHSTALPASIPTSDSDQVEIYDTHTPTVSLDDNSGINEEGTSGHVVTLTNNTENTIGSYATYGIQYQYQWGDGTASTTVNVGSGAAGDTGGTIQHTFALSAGDQASGTPADYTGNLRVISNHTGSPFISSNFTVHVEPDVRAIIAGTAVTTSDRSGDNQYDLYDFTDYDGNNRALVRVTNTSQNADDYEYDWADGSTNDTPTEDGSSAGSIGATLDHDFAGQSAGSYNLTFTANGTPDLTAQTDTDTGITFVMNATPAAPSNLSAFTLPLADAFQGTNPKLAASFDDNSATTPISAGTALTSTTARRYTSGTIDTQVVNNVYDGGAGTLTAVINGVDRGNKTFTSATGENGTFTSLVVSDQDDANNTISSSTYPTGFYQTFDAKITQALASYSVGLNDQRLEHSTTGNTNYVSVVYDDVTSAPSIASAGTLAEGTGGTKRYISGIPYYNSGTPTVNLTGVQVSNLTGQAYTDQSNIVEVDTATNQEGTSSAGTVNTDYNYAAIDGAVTMLSGGIPLADTGVASAYTLGTLAIGITTSSVRTIDRVQIRARNCNGVGSYSENATNIQVHTAAQSGISEIAIAVADALGDTYDDDGLRITDFLADTTDTPSYSGATNFYTNAPYTESSDPGVSGTKEATVRLGVLKHDTTDYSSGYLPLGPDRSADTGTQYFTFAFRRTTMANFDLNITSSGVAGVWIAAPGTAIDSASGLNGWLRADTTYGGSGVPGSNTGSGGNGSDGCAFTSGDRIQPSTSLSGGYTMTLGAENGSNATGNVILVRIALTSGQSVTALSVGVAS